MPNAKRLDLTKKGEKWVAKTKGGDTYASAPRKADAVKATAAKARRDPDAVSVRIHKEDGKFQEERTYPRRADPPSSKG